MSMVRAYVSKDRIAMVVLHDLTFAARWGRQDHRDEEWRASRRRVTRRSNHAGDVGIVYGVKARVQRCNRGFLQIIVDGRS